MIRKIGCIFALMLIIITTSSCGSNQKGPTVDLSDVSMLSITADIPENSGPSLRPDPDHRGHLHLHVLLE